MKRKSQRATRKTKNKRGSKQRVKAVTPRSAKQFLAKSSTFQDKLTRVANVISKMRSEKVSLRQASRESGINPRTVVRWGGFALQKRKNGKYVAKPNDRLLRIVVIPTAEGTREIIVRGSRQATLLGQYWNAVHRYLARGDASQLRKFRSKKIKDATGAEIPLLTDQKVLDRLASAGVLSFESIYRRAA